MALVNSAAFEQIRSLQVGLEQQVAARTRDLSDALEELQQAQLQLVETEKQAMLGRLVAGIVHEINTPLGVLRSSADTAGRTLQRYRGFVEAQAADGDTNAVRLLSATAQAERLTTLMHESSERINQLVASLKQFVALDEAEFRAYDVREGIDSAVTLLSPTCGDGVRITKRYPEQAPRVDCNPARLNQVFVNLLQNAADALAGEGSIDIQVARRHGEVTIEFSDDGPGIPVDRLGELFEFGFTQKAGRIGLRLGLPSSKRLLQDMGGQISIDSQPGHGTQVRVVIPESASGSSPA